MVSKDNGKTPSSKTPSKKAAMPSAGAINNARKGGLGRGLGALIPTGPARPSLGNSAADLILGASKTAQRPGSAPTTQPSADTSGTASGNAQGNGRADGWASGRRIGREDGPLGRSGENAKGSPGSAEHAFSKRHSDDSPTTHSKGKNPPVESDTSAPNGSKQDGSGIGATYREIPLHSIRANAKQPRSVFDEEALKELEHSIREFGLMQPIVVRAASDGETEFELIMGERRLRAAARVGLDVIPAIVRETDDEAMLRDALLENIHRVQLNPLEEAAAYQQLMEEFHVTQTELAERIGRSRPRITNMIRLMQLPVAVQRRVAAGVLSGGHARALLGVKAGAEAQEALANRVISEGLSVRATEEAVVLLNREAGNERSRRSQGQKAPLPSHVNHWVNDISDALETKVSVQMGKKKGKIVVEFGGPEDFDRIAEILRFQRD